MSNRRTLRALLLAFTFAFSLSAHAVADQRKLVDVRAGSLADALETLAKQCGVDVIYPSNQLKGLTTSGVQGELGVLEAFVKLVEGTSLVVREEGASVLIMLPQGASGANGAKGAQSENSAVLLRLAQTGQSDVAGARPAAVAHADGSQGASTPENAGRLGEVIVTALKREQSLLDAPVAVSAFTSQDMEDSGARQLADFLQSAPGATIVDGGTGDQRISIRGISSLYGDSPVGYYLDEVPFNLIGATVVPDVRTFDLERVEILRGPQGTLYGASSLGGTVRILTRDPVFNDFQAKVDLSGSRTDHGGDNYGVFAAVNIPMVDDTLALRIAGTLEDFAGWLDEPINGIADVNDRRIETVRAKLRWVPSDSVELVLGAWTYDNDTDASATGNDDGEYVDSVVPGAISPTHSEYDLFSGNLTIATPWFDVVSSTSYMETRSVNSGSFTNDRPADTFAQEIRLSSLGDQTWDWTAGVYYRDLTTQFIFQLPGFPASTQDTDSKSYAVFGEVTYALTSRLDVTVGMRYFDDDRGRTDTVLAGFDPDTFEPIIETVAFEENYSTFNPRLNLAWRSGNGTLAYFNAAKGFRSGFTQPGISLFVAEQVGIEIPNGAKEETAWSYEFGAKSQFADNRIALEAAVYYIDWKDLQTVVTIIPGALGAVVNAGKARAVGIDLGVTVSPFDGLELALTGNINESEYREDVNDTVGVVVANGQRIQGFPKSTVAASANYSRQFGARGWRGVGHFRIERTSERSLNFGSVTTEGDKITQAALRVGLEGEQWGAYLFADNLFDEDGMVDGPGLTPATADVATRLRPRTFGLNLRFDF